jgi:hypothetical protein
MAIEAFYRHLCLSILILHRKNNTVKQYINIGEAKYTVVEMMCPLINNYRVQK